MCGIVAIFESCQSPEELRKLIVQLGKRIRHRGPDWSGVCRVEHGAIAHERLAIVDPESGEQPLTCEVPWEHGTAQITLAVNGEIYNHDELRKDLNHSFKTGSDCEVILPLYVKHGMEFVNLLRGMFSFVIHDSRDGSFYAVRDHMGIIPLFIGWRADGGICFSSELKGLNDACVRFEVFPPGHFYDSHSGEIKPWYKPSWYDPVFEPSKKTTLQEVRQTLTGSVRRRMMSDVPWGVLLSGGLDSSLIASIACRILRDDKDKSLAWGGKLHSFCIGLKGSPDLVKAKQVADFLGTIHHSFVFSVQEGLDALEDVIYALETYDTTTIRAATPMYLMARKIKATGVKMVLSGEGADEIFGGYLYFHKCPSPSEFQKETVSKLQMLHLYDCLRANKATSAWGLEARVPFLDRDCLDVFMTMDPAMKMCQDEDGNARMEKWVVRKAFEDPDDPYLPQEVLWRQKEQFSDGVGYTWIDSLRDLAEREVSDRMFKQAFKLFPHNPPPTKENYLYRSIYMKHFPQHSAELCVPGGPSVACSTPAAVKWSKDFEDLVSKAAGDCSGRAVSVHNDAYFDAVAVATGAHAKAVSEKQNHFDGLL